MKIEFVSNMHKIESLQRFLIHLPLAEQLMGIKNKSDKEEALPNQQNRPIEKYL
jgi:hypothetical protein